MLKRSLCAAISCLSLAVACGGSDDSDTSSATSQTGDTTAMGDTSGGSMSGSTSGDDTSGSSSGGSDDSQGDTSSGSSSDGSGSATDSSGSSSTDSTDSTTGDDSSTTASSDDTAADDAADDDSTSSDDGSMASTDDTGADETSTDDMTDDTAADDTAADDTGDDAMAADDTAADDTAADDTATDDMAADDMAADDMAADDMAADDADTGSSDSGECRVWLAPDGDDGNDGTEGAPLATLHAAYDMMCPKPVVEVDNGEECSGPAPRTICVKSGTYPMTERLEFKKTRMGTADNRLTVMGAPGNTEKPLFDFSGQERLECGANPDNIGGLTVNAHYVTVKDIAITGANDNCILVQGYEGVIENVLVYGCADTGIQISSGGEYENSGHNNTILNCDSHSNNDVQCDGENADGFAIKEGTGNNNSFIGCRAWNNADDGYDFYAWTSTVHLENSWAFDQCRTTMGGGSDCNGFKLGGDDISATHELIDLVAVGNSRGTGNGFTENSNPANLNCSGDCYSWGNKVDVDSVSGVSTSAVGGVTVDAMAADSARNADGSLKSITEL